MVDIDLVTLIQHRLASSLYKPNSIQLHRSNVSHAANPKFTPLSMYDKTRADKLAKIELETSLTNRATILSH